MSFVTKKNCIFSNIYNLFQGVIYSSDTWLLKENHDWTMVLHGIGKAIRAFSQSPPDVRILTFLFWCSHVNADSLTQSVKMKIPGFILPSNSCDPSLTLAQYFPFLFPSPDYRAFSPSNLTIGSLFMFVKILTIIYP